MEHSTGTHYCQTCGMPLNANNHEKFGAGLDAEYCDYCRENGVKAYDFTMDYLIYLWGLFPDQYSEEAGESYTSHQVREIMSRRLPHIRRWKQKINTAHVQYELVTRVQEYINRHLFDELDSDNLARVAGLSKFHFRRIFRAVAGESLGTYIQRLRLEYIAFLLISTDASVPKILGRINYRNKHTLSRAFKAYFDCTIPEFREIHSNVSPEGKSPVRIVPGIEKLPAMRVAYLKFERTNNPRRTFLVLWEQLMQFSESHGLPSQGSKYVSLNLDHPFITPEEQGRFMIGVTLPKSFEAPKGIGVYEILAGEYAIFRFQGLYHQLNSVYRHIYLDWLPTSDYTLREQFTFETYVNTPDKTPAAELITDIYVPVTKKETK